MDDPFEKITGGWPAGEMAIVTAGSEEGRSLYEQMREISKRCCIPAHTRMVTMGARRLGRSALNAELWISLERSQESVERLVNMQIPKKRGSMDLLTFDEAAHFTAEIWNKPLNLKHTQVCLAVKGQFK